MDEALGDHSRYSIPIILSFGKDRTSIDRGWLVLNVSFSVCRRLDFLLDINPSDLICLRVISYTIKYQYQYPYQASAIYSIQAQAVVQTEECPVSGIYHPHPHQPTIPSHGLDESWGLQCLFASRLQHYIILFMETKMGAFLSFFFPFSFCCGTHGTAQVNWSFKRKEDGLASGREQRFWKECLWKDFARRDSGWLGDGGKAEGTVDR